MEPFPDQDARLTTWYYIKNGARHGPIGHSDLAQLVLSREILPTDLVWKPGMPEWKTASDVEGVYQPPMTESSPHRNPPAAPSAVESLGTQSVSSASAATERPTRPYRWVEPETCSVEPETSKTLNDPPPSRPTAAPESNYFTKHWRGELPLSTSYWVNGLLAAAAIIAVSSATAKLDVQPHPKLFSAAQIGLLLGVYPALVVWQLVGIWRSACMHTSRGGSPVWSRLAKFMVVVGILSLAVRMTQSAVPASTEYWKILTGRDSVGDVTLRVLRDATELEVNGGIGFGLTDQVRQYLDAHPTIRIVHLNSQGGRIAEARALARLIEQRGLTTYTATMCASACILPYAAGSSRLIAREGKLGFHQYSFPGLTNVDFAEEYAIDQRYLRARGLEPSFLEKAYSKGPNDMWTPTQEELHSANVVTARAHFDQTAISGLSASELQNLELALSKQKLFSALKVSDPEVYAALVEDFKQAAMKGRSLAEVRAKFIPSLTRLRDERIPFASDKAIVTYTQLMVDQLKYLRTKDPKLCYRYSMQADSKTMEDAAAMFPEALLDRELDAMGQVIRTGKERVFQPGSKESVEIQIEAVMGTLAERYGDDVRILQTPEHMGREQRKTCDLVIAFYSEALKLPLDKAGPVLRTLWK